MGRLKDLELAKETVKLQAAEILRLTQALIEAQARYDALDEGRTEIEENFQQMMIEASEKYTKLTDRIEDVKQELDELKKQRAEHDKICLHGITFE